MAEKLTKADIKLAQDYKKALEGAGKAYQNLNKGTKDFGKTSKKEMKAAIKDLDDVNTGLEDMEKEVVSLQRSLKKVAKGGALKKEDAVQYNNELKKIEAEIIRIHNMKGKGGGPLTGGALKTQQRSLETLKKSFGGAKKNINKLEKASVDWDDKLSKVGPAFLRNWASGRKTAKAAGKEVAKMPELFKAAGAAAKGLGGIMGGVTKMMTGWPGLILGAVKAAIDLTRAADQFVKDANEAFATIRGPDIMTGDIKEQFKDFNDMIYRAGDNIRVGLDVTQIRELLLAVRQAGANITDLNKGLLTYRDAIYVASKASKILGLELPMVGDMMGKMIVDMRMDLDQMDRAFVQVAFDAKKSGLSTDRFWSTVQNASASLALYGVIVKSASSTMKAFTENMVGGADDAAEATENMFDVFKKGSLKANLAIIQFARQGGMSSKKVFQEMAEEAAKRIDIIKGDIKIKAAKGSKMTSEEAKELKKLRSQLYAAQSKQNRFEKAAKGSDIDRAVESGALAKKAPLMIIAALTRAVERPLHEIAGNDLAVAIKAGAQMEQSEKTVKMLVEQAKITKEMLEDLASKSGKYFNLSGTKNDETRKKLVEAITKTANTTGEAQIDAADSLISVLKGIGMDPEEAATWTKMIKSDKENAESIAGIIDKGSTGMAAKISDIVTSNRANNRMNAAHYTEQGKTESKMSEAAEDTFKGIVGQTLSYNKMIKIAKNEVQWRLGSLGIFQSLNTGVNNILKHLIGDDLSFSQKRAQEQIKATLATGSTLEELSWLARKGDLSQKDQEDITKKVVEKLSDTNKTIELQEATGGVLEKAGKVEKGKSPWTVFEKEITKLKESLKDEKISPEQKQQTKNTITGLERIRDKLGKMESMEAHLKAMVPALAKGDEAARNEIETMAKAMPEDDPIKPILNKILKMSDKGQIIIKKDEKINEEISKILPTKLEDLKEESKKSLIEAREEKAVLEKTEKELVELNKSNNTIATLARLQLTSSPEYMKKLKEEVKAQRAEGKSFEQISGGTGVSLEVIKKSYEGEKVPEELIAAISEQMPGPGGMRKDDFYDIVKGGLVNVKSGDILVDKNSFAQGTGGAPGAAMPSIAAAAGGTGAGTGGGSTTIQINVTATEKDLAGKIANQIKKELYNRQISTSSYSLA